MTQKITLNENDIQILVRNAVSKLISEGLNDSTNANMNIAKSSVNDEFYTKKEDVDNELSHYSKYFSGKKVYCPCDGPQSEIFRWFLSNFNSLNIKDLCATSFSFEGTGRLIYVRDGEIKIDRPMKGDGDFRNDESLKLMERCDIVVTNPPFSLFRDILSRCLNFGKKFILLGNMNESVTSSIFPLMKTGEVHYGYTRQTGFNQPDGDKKKYVHGMTRWFTNLPVDRDNKFSPKSEYDPDRHITIDKKDDTEEDIINVNSVRDIPNDYDGKMLVPITIFDSYLDPEEYEVLGVKRPYIGGKKKFVRVLIQRKPEEQPVYALRESDIRRMVSNVLSEIKNDGSTMWSVDNYLCRFPYRVPLKFTDHAIDRKDERYISARSIFNNIKSVMPQVFRDFEEGRLKSDDAFEVMNRDTCVRSVGRVITYPSEPGKKGRIKLILVITAYIWTGMKNNLEGSHIMYFIGEPSYKYEEAVKWNQEHQQDVEDYLSWRYPTNLLRKLARKAEKEYFYNNHAKEASHDKRMSRVDRMLRDKEWQQKKDIHDALPDGDLEAIRGYFKDFDKRKIDLEPLEQ